MRGRAYKPELLAYLMGQHELGRSLTELGQENGISRRVLSRWWKRYQQEGFDGLKPGPWHYETDSRDDDPSVLGTRIREAREQAGYKTQLELCEAIKERGGKITPQYISQLERGKGTAAPATLRMIFSACRVNVSDIPEADVRIKEDATILGARIREMRERAGYKTPGQLWSAIKSRGGNITRQYIYHLEHGKSTASAKKLTMIVDACGMTMSDFLGTDLIIGPRGDTNIQERKLVTMLTKIRTLNPTLARVVESAVISAYDEVLKARTKN